MDRYYQHHGNFDLYQQEGKHFICRIKAKTKKTCIKSNDLPEDGFIFYDAVVLLGTPGVNQTKKQVRLVGDTVDGTKYWIAPLTALILRLDKSPWRINSGGRLRSFSHGGSAT
jgi:hypothetical protein